MAAAFTPFNVANPDRKSEFTTIWLSQPRRTGATYYAPFTNPVVLTGNDFATGSHQLV